jgi:SET and MYND domain-containing protein
VVRTDVKEGEELCYSYIDLYQGRSKRKTELLETKHFDCLCDRCSPPITDSVVRAWPFLRYLFI